MLERFVIQLYANKILGEEIGLYKMLLNFLPIYYYYLVDVGTGTSLNVSIIKKCEINTDKLSAKDFIIYHTHIIENKDIQYIVKIIYKKSPYFLYNDDIIDFTECPQIYRTGYIIQKLQEDPLKWNGYYTFKKTEVDLLK